MVTVSRDRGPESTPKNLGVVELWVARVGASDEDPADRISSPPPKTPLAGLIEAWVLVKERRQNGSSHKVFDDAVSSRRSVSLGIADSALPIRRLTVVRLIDAREKGPPRELYVIKCSPRSEEHTSELQSLRHL